MMAYNRRIRRGPGLANRVWQQRGALLTAALLGAAALLAASARFSASAAGGSAGGLPGPSALGQLRSLAPGQTAPPGVIAAALASDPLAPEPFVAAGNAAALRNPGGRQTRALYGEAVRRDPHELLPRLALLQSQVHAGRIGAAIGQLSVVWRIENGVAAEVLTRLGATTDSAPHADLALGALASHPELVASYLNGFSTVTHPQPLIMHVVNGVTPGALAIPDARNLVIALRVTARDYAGARALSRTGRASEGAVHSPDFADLAAPPPFGWQLATGEFGAAEASPQGGIDLAAYGRAPGVLLRQLVVLTPGPHRVTLRYEPQGGADGVLVARLVCADTGNALGKQGLRAGGEGLRVLNLEVTVPPAGAMAGACGGQYLDIASVVPGEMAAEQEVRAVRYGIDEGTRHERARNEGIGQ